MSTVAEEEHYLAAHLARVDEAWPSGVPTEAWYPHGQRPLTEYLRAWARQQPDKPAVIFYGREVTYAELDRLSDRFAALLAAHGVRTGDRVAVFLPNCPQFHIAFFGILKLGAVHAPVSPLSKPFELAYQLADTGAETILTLDSLMPVLRAVKNETRVRTALVTSFADMLPTEPTLPLPEMLKAGKVACPDAIDLMPALAAVAEPPPAVRVGLDDVAALNYTGGTTGMPKGCIHSQGDMIYTAATNLGIAAPVSSDTVALSFFPEFWIAGENGCLIFPVFGGYTLVLLSRWDPVAFLEAIQLYRVTNTGLPVDGAVELMDHPRFGEFDLSSLRQVRVVSFVKKLNLEFRSRWKELTGTVLAESAWGMTETHTSDTFTTGMQENDFDLRSQPVFVGLPMPGTELKICDFETGALVPFGQEGEICCRSPSLLKGYWGRPEATAEALRGGWLHSGDIGMIDESGYLHFLGRRKEMLKVKGMSVFPAEIEAVLGQHPAVNGSGVIGRSDPERGQVPVAFVRLNPAAAATTGDEIRAWLGQRIASYKVPDIRILDELPMTATGKVKKGELAAFLE
ncbi:MAG: acyl-CoA synthetase [Enterovirga sp.]|nr:acyl-CoA synthetase [Enterovirga sp.]